MNNKNFECFKKNFDIKCQNRQLVPINLDRSVEDNVSLEMKTTTSDFSPKLEALTIARLPNMKMMTVRSRYIC